MVGIGITTKNRPELLNALLDSIYKHTFMDDVMLYVADDSIDNLGVAKKKNECLRYLKNCDYIFLLDDDIEIIKEGWIEFCINEGSEHLLFMDDKFHRKIDDKNYLDCGGVFMFMTKEVIDRVGAFNEKFMQYGFEHCEYTNRITGQRTHYPTNLNLKEYIYAHDYSTANHKSSITDEEKQIHIKNNWDKFFNEPIKNVFLPL